MLWMNKSGLIFSTVISSALVNVNFLEDISKYFLTNKDFCSHFLLTALQKPKKCLGSYLKDATMLSIEPITSNI